MKSLKESTKIINSIMLGMMGFFGAFLSMDFSSEIHTITIHWSFLFPLMAAMAYGGKYGVISGVLGLGAFFPLILWPSNGWANLIAIVLYVMLFAYHGYFERKRESSPSFWNRPAIVYLPFMLFYSFSTYVFYPIAFRSNPPFWTDFAHKTISDGVINNIIAKEIVLIFFVLILTNSLLRINSVRHVLGLNRKLGYKYNGWIFIATLMSSVTFWAVYIVFSHVFIDKDFPINILVVNNGYVLIGLMASLFLAVSIACIGMQLAEHNSSINEILKLRESQISSISNNLVSGMLYQVVVGPNGNKKFTFVSESVEDIIGFTPEQIYKNYNLQYESILPEDRNMFMEAENEAIRNLSLFKSNIRVRTAKGEVRWFTFVSSPTKMDDGSTVWDGIEFDINEQVEIQEALQMEKEKLKSKQEHIEYLSFHDHLTGLFNRRFYEAELERLDHPRNLPISIVMADVNGLKLTNDAFGHSAGDELLIEVAEVFKRVCRVDDIAARIGGDEFILLLPKTDEYEAQQIVKRLRETFVHAENSKIIVSVSFGLGVKSDENICMNDVFAYAEDAMYREKLTESKSMRSETIKIIVKTLYEMHSMEKSHSENVSSLSQSLAKAYGLNSEEVKDMGLAGMLHDIGKIGIDETLLSKEGELNPSEWIELKRHPEIGYQILRSVNEFVEIAEFILAHHERIDGNGYPRHLRGDDIPVQSRILAIADAFDAMTQYRLYKDTLSENEAIEELIRNSGTQFDENLVKVFVEKVLHAKGHKKKTEEVN
ncbi:MAG: diguanylate cyclase [Clostridia bacterium]|nr:diguanylate cyclase [Clostridia bacterium]